MTQWKCSALRPHRGFTPRFDDKGDRLPPPASAVVEADSVAEAVKEYCNSKDVEPHGVTEATATRITIKAEPVVTPARSMEPDE